MLGCVDVTAANTWVEVPFAPVLANGQAATFDLYLVNHAASGTSQVRVAVGPSASGGITDAHLIEFDTDMAPKAVLKHTRLTCRHDQRIWVRASLAQINAIMFGIVENA